MEAQADSLLSPITTAADRSDTTTRLVAKVSSCLVAQARQLFLNLRKPNHLFPVATVVCLREANTAFLQCTKGGTLV